VGRDSRPVMIIVNERKEGATGLLEKKPSNVHTLTISSLMGGLRQKDTRKAACHGGDSPQTSIAEDGSHSKIERKKKKFAFPIEGNFRKEVAKSGTNVSIPQPGRRPLRGKKSSRRGIRTLRGKERPNALANRCSIEEGVGRAPYEKRGFSPAMVPLRNQPLP